MEPIKEKVLILDFGSQLTQLITRRVRELKVYSEIRPFNMSLKEIKAFDPVAIILSGGPSSVSEENAPTVDKAIFDLGIPILGICYGKQLMCDLLGGKVELSGEREFGRAFIDIINSSPLLKGYAPKGAKRQVWMSHSDKVTKLPQGFTVLAKTKSTPYAIIANEKKRFYAIQFHPEVHHTPEGIKLLKNFLYTIAGCKGTWSMADFLKSQIKEIRAKVGKDHVICAVSGGVDSTVVAVLLNEAIGEQLHCIFVDTGLLRLQEGQQVSDMFRQNFNIPLNYVGGANIFLSALEGVSDPEQKRKIIGKTFIDIFEAEAKKVGKVKYLAQGTLYPDVVESISAKGGPSAVIKSHHNVGGLPDRMKLKLIEPLRELFKDEVRALGRELGIPPQMLYRHPFPGPGLAIRIPGEITQEKIHILQQADAIYIEELRAKKLYDKIWQAFTVLLPVKTVGVMGDARTYEYVAALRAVTSSDGMTADYYPFDHEFLGHVSSRIIGEVRGINRVVYDITSKPPGTIEWE